MPAIEVVTKAADAMKPARGSSGEPVATAGSRAIIEIALPNGAVVRVDGAVDAKTLGTVLGTLVDS